MPRRAASRGCSARRGPAAWVIRCGTRPVRVIVCHWSRMRPVLRVSRSPAWLSGRRRRESGACARGHPAWGSRRARRDALPSALGQVSGKAIARAPARHKRRRRDAASAPMSKMRSPSFSNADSAACSRKMSAALRIAKMPSPSPCGAPRCANIHQSGRASPGAAGNARWREMRRSELVTVPSFSPQAGGGQHDMGKRGGVGGPGSRRRRRTDISPAPRARARRAACCRPDWSRRSRSP